jgi:hypothetical protein
MYLAGSQISCGVKQLYNLDLAEFKAVFGQRAKKKREPLSYWDEYDEIGDRFETGYTYLLSDIASDPNHHGQSIADFIRANDLGTLTEHGEVRNPNSGNQIKVWVWTYNGNKPKTRKRGTKTPKRLGRKS